jgi:hypothetical protein
MSRQARSSAAAPMAARQNEYFVPRDGIDREVITADICRYLGNDALVRPGPYEVGNPPVAPAFSLSSCSRCRLLGSNYWPDRPRLLHQRIPKPNIGKETSTTSAQYRTHVAPAQLLTKHLSSR